MRSSELAELAGVTVRTLRHYHQIGLLPEPPRSAGGYRHYGVDHLVRLLRITRLTALGVPLSELPSVLDDSAAAEELLDDLDRRTAAEIERLTARRASIAALRRTGTPPDLDPALAARRSADAEQSPGMARYEHELLILAGHLLADDPAGLAALFSGADEDEAAFAGLTARFYALDAGTPEEDVAALADDLVAHLVPLLTRLGPPALFDRRAARLVDQFSEHALRPVQHRVLRLVQRRLVARDGS
ncbi:MerR family transcriptional regulator [Streptomyces sp. NPDC101181]|uniref:MerR family transcriptional regulator n=1 Tax=Streptomyces sp. NPDC101181 TaxID=3366125 RepID=UPI0037F81516